jgi:D-xylose transport system permease protein
MGRGAAGWASGFRRHFSFTGEIVPLESTVPREALAETPPPFRRINVFQRFAGWAGVDVRLVGMLAALALIWVGFHFLTERTFLTSRNLWNLMVQSSVVGVMVGGMVLVIVARQIDLSVGSVLGFVGMVMAFIQAQVLPLEAWWNPLATILIGLALGGLIGAFHGYVVAYLEVPSFILTLGSLLAFRGGAWLVTSGRTIAPLDNTFQIFGGGINGSIGATWSWVVGLAAIALVVWYFLSSRGRRRKYGFLVRPLWAEFVVIAINVAFVAGFVQLMNSYPYPGTTVPRGLPVPVLLMLALGVLMSTVLRSTRFWRYVFAIGGNPEAARFSGIPTRRITLTVFVIMGVLAAIAGIIATARLNAGTNSAGELAELSVIAAAVIGGTSLSGGVGSIPGAMIGAVLIESLRNGMVLMNMHSALQNVVQGAFLVLAVWLDVLYQRYRRR